MKIHLIQIAERGVPNKERLHLGVTQDTNLAYYVIFASSFNSERTGVYTQPRHTYWFQDKPVEVGDQVVLYTGKGSNSSEKRPDGKTNYFFYWGLPNPAFADSLDCTVIFEATSWNTAG